MHIGPLLGSGRTADVYALDDSWVLRRYRGDTDATAELAVMSYLSAHGYPLPRIGPPGGAEVLPQDLVIQRLTGPTLADALLAGTVTMAEGADVLARLLRELHAIPPRISQDPADRILHLDLHPENVMLAPRGAVVIDWTTAAEGPPALDRAVSSLILAQIAVDPEFTAGANVQALLATFLERLADDGGVPADALTRATALRAVNPGLSDREKALLDEAAALVTALTD
ncbi:MULTISPECIES: phosphotransferase [Streptomyces]|uniref:phosphotransferase n=1 Tax=Streptomyces TaxID=1883 RepID=UPI00048C2199|nr:MULTISPECIES: phosphotransferase [unclassified Streptomyces]WSX37448.1 phosphotransferase [Streptomyces halstedii]KDQ68032.1 aminoglycoside phosphotransferase [Streptomyces sp. NTK 937]MYR73270.1 phosphotransferase [Streptomyces sp. SID4925]MYY18937.1 phosphotransferase [Streptomyces sp. SID4912]SBU97367.1 Phosphotransferase enzyme family protein [Streptomyces sp. OspMP-M45]